MKKAFAGGSVALYYPPTDETQLKCPHHNCGLVQVRNRSTGKDQFTCPKFLECSYTYEPGPPGQETLDPTTVKRDPATGTALCHCGYVTHRFVCRKPGKYMNRPFWRCPADRGKQCTCRVFGRQTCGSHIHNGKGRFPWQGRA